HGLGGDVARLSQLRTPAGTRSPLRARPAELGRGGRRRLSDRLESGTMPRAQLNHQVASAECRGNFVRESAVKPVRKTDAGNRHVRFDERGWEAGRRSGVSARAHPRLYKLTESHELESLVSEPDFHIASVNV